MRLWKQKNPRFFSLLPIFLWIKLWSKAILEEIHWSPSWPCLYIQNIPKSFQEPIHNCYILVQKNHKSYIYVILLERIKRFIYCCDILPSALSPLSSSVTNNSKDLLRCKSHTYKFHTWFPILLARLCWGWRQMPHKGTLIPAELEGAFCSKTECDTPLFLPTSFPYVTLLLQRNNPLSHTEFPAL